jgi:hypothetical protein
MTETNAAARSTGEGFLLVRDAFGDHELTKLRDGLEAAVQRLTKAAAERSDVDATVTADGHRLETVLGTSVHWEPDADPPTVRNLRPVTHLDRRLDALWSDPRLTGPAAELLGVDAVSPLTSKASFKRARVGSEFPWHQDSTFLEGFLGPAAAEVVTAIVFLDGANADNGALRFLPGSQLEGPMGDDPVDESREVTVEAPAGSVLLFPSLLIHRSSPNRSDRDRRAVLYLYQPDGRPPLDESNM